MKKIISMMLILTFCLTSTITFALSMPKQSKREKSKAMSEDTICENLKSIIEEYKTKCNNIGYTLTPAAVFSPLLQELNNKFAMSLKYSDIFKNDRYLYLVNKSNWSEEELKEFNNSKDALFNDLYASVRLLVLKQFSK